MMRRIPFTFLSLGFLAVVVSLQVGCDSPLFSWLWKHAEDHVTWTDKAIEADPEGYLNFIKNECDQAVSSVNAARIGFRREKSKLQAEAATAGANLERYREQLAAYKDAYRGGEASGDWPVSTPSGQRISKLDLQTVILEKNRLIDTAERHAAENPSLVQQIDNRLADLDVKEVQLRQSKIKAEKKLKDLRLGHVYNRVDEIEVQMENVEFGPDSLGDLKHKVGLDDIETPVNPEQTSFDSIMAK